MKRIYPYILGSAAITLSACVPPPGAKTTPTVAVSTSTAAVALSTAPAGDPIRLVPPDQWPLIKDELDKASLAKAAKKSLEYLRSLPTGNNRFKILDRDLAPGILIDTLESLLKVIEETPAGEDITPKLKQSFDLYQSNGTDGVGRVVFSSYYQPVISASLKPTSKFKYPIYKRPSNMIDVDLGAFNSKLKGESLLGRLTKEGRLVPYFDRRDIDVRKVLSGKGLEVAWLESPFDRLDLHIQGSGILKLPSGKYVMAKFAATNALPYKSVGSVVLASGAMSRSDMNHERLKQYLDSHPEGESWLISQNPRYTFFDIGPMPDDGEPFGTIERSLTSGRSIAIDPKFIPLGTVAYIQTPMPQASKEGNLLGVFPTSRFMMCQDTGGAILGPGRVDIYIGHGPQAKTSAVNQWHEGKLYFLIKKLPPRDR